MTLSPIWLIIKDKLYLISLMFVIKKLLLVIWEKLISINPMTYNSSKKNRILVA